MKKMKFFVTLAVALAMFASCDKEKNITESELPASSRTFLNTHFSGVNIGHIKMDKELFDKSYTVYLQNGFEVDFVKSGDWDEVDGHITAVPQSILDLLPAGIVQHVSANFPNREIVKVNKERYGYEIGLFGDLDLEFNSNGGFIRVD